MSKWFYVPIPIIILLLTACRARVEHPTRPAADEIIVE